MRSDQIGIFKRVLIFEGRGKPEYTEKNLSEKPEERTNNNLNPYMASASTSGFEPEQSW